MMRKVMIAMLILAAATVGCGGENVPAIDKDFGEGPWVDVPCALRVVDESQIELEFTNTSRKPQTFLVAKGIPPLEVVSTWRRVVLEAYFVCTFEYVHDDFHAQTVTLEPGTSTKVPITYMPDELKGLVGKGALPCTYRTLRERDLKQFPVGGLTAPAH